MGLMVWQDFAMACGVYPTDWEFRDLMYREAAKLPGEYLTESHIWGPRDYFKSEFYKGSLAHFASEIGYHGSVSVKSMMRFISPDKLWPWRDNDEWLVHAASPETGKDGPYVCRIELMAKQVKELFDLIPEGLEDFVLASQISQAEAKGFFVELFRVQAHRSGIIWWNLIDGWPQFSDAVVDYYFHKKLAYYYLRQSQQPLLLSFSESENWKLPFYASNVCGTGPPDLFLADTGLRIRAAPALRAGPGG
jgi:beta-mannosidase